MRARLQKANVLVIPKYEKDLGSVIIYGDDDRPIFAVTTTIAGAYQYTHIGLPDFSQVIKDITGTTTKDSKLVEMEPNDQLS